MVRFLFKIFPNFADYRRMAMIQNFLVARLSEESKKPLKEQANILLLLEHSPVYTIGRRNKMQQHSELMATLTMKGAEFVSSQRGGQITFHGPGQLVGYPIFNLKHLNLGVRLYIDHIQEILKKTCLDFKVETKNHAETGVWVNDNEKIAAIGIHVQRYITSHGFGLNCNTDLKWFGYINPCGLAGKTATSLTAVTKKTITVHETIPIVIDHFCNQFQADFQDLKDVDPNLNDILDSLYGNSNPKNYNGYQ